MQTFEKLVFDCQTIAEARAAMLTLDIDNEGIYRATLMVPDAVFLSALDKVSAGHRAHEYFIWDEGEDWRTYAASLAPWQRFTFDYNRKTITVVNTTEPEGDDALDWASWVARRELSLTDRLTIAQAFRNITGWSH